MPTPTPFDPRTDPESVDPESLDPLVPPEEATGDGPPNPAREAASRWRGVLPADLVDGLAARPAVARTFGRMPLSDIRAAVRFLEAARSTSVRRHRLRRLLAGLARVPDRERSA